MGRDGQLLGSLEDILPEIFDPATGAFSPAAPIGESTYPGAEAVVLVDGRLLLFPDRCDDRWDHPTAAGHHVANAEFYDPASGRYRAAGQLPNCVDTATALPNGEVLVTGFWWDLEARHDQSGGGTFPWFGRRGDAHRLVGPVRSGHRRDARDSPGRESRPGRTFLLPDGNVLILDFRGPSLFR